MDVEVSCEALELPGGGGGGLDFGVLGEVFEIPELCCCPWISLWPALSGFCLVSSSFSPFFSKPELPPCTLEVFFDDGLSS